MPPPPLLSPRLFPKVLPLACPTRMHPLLLRRNDHVCSTKNMVLRPSQKTVKTFGSTSSQTMTPASEKASPSFLMFMCHPFGGRCQLFSLQDPNLYKSYLFLQIWILLRWIQSYKIYVAVVLKLWIIEPTSFHI